MMGLVIRPWHLSIMAGPAAIVRTGLTMCPLSPAFSASIQIVNQTVDGKAREQSATRSDRVHPTLLRGQSSQA